MVENQTHRLVVAHLSDALAKKELRRLDCDSQFIRSLARVLSTEFSRPPSLFVLDVSGSDSQEAQEVIETLRYQRPLTDVLVWAAKAAGGSVRSFFRVGAKDVIVSSSPGALANAVAETLREQQLLPRVNDLSRKRTTSARFESMLSRSEVMWDQFELCDRIAPTEATVLIVGETGTGKELLARAVHRRSQRAGRFVAANCASVAADLINSQLFGHVKGAFTGADRDKQGLVCHAQQGTLFLDEIGDMPPEGQQSLLRMLQEKRIRPVGSLSEIKTEVRVVAATNVPLDQAVREGSFREDLFYRLDVIRMSVPPLRQRPEDIVFLFGHFVKRLARHYDVSVPTYGDSFLDALLAYAWPGNVRQLRNFSERLVLSRPQEALTDRDFDRLRGASLEDAVDTDSGRARQISLARRVDPTKSLRDNVEPSMEALERDYLRVVLEQNGGRMTDAARQAGISRRTLLRKMKALGIDKRSFKQMT